MNNTPYYEIILYLHRGLAFTCRAAVMGCLLTSSTGYMTHPQWPVQLTPTPGQVYFSPLVLAQTTLRQADRGIILYLCISTYIHLLHYYYTWYYLSTCQVCRLQYSPQILLLGLVFSKSMLIRLEFSVVTSYKLVPTKKAWTLSKPKNVQPYTQLLIVWIE